MGTFAETAIVDYRLSFSNQKLPFSVSIFSKQTEFPFPFLLATGKRVVCFLFAEFGKHGDGEM